MADSPKQTIRLGFKLFDADRSARPITALLHQLPRHHHPPFRFEAQNRRGAIGFSLILAGRGTLPDGVVIGPGSHLRIDPGVRFVVDHRQAWRECSMMLDRATLQALQLLGLLRDVPPHGEVTEVDAVHEAFMAVLVGCENSLSEMELTARLVRWAAALTAQLDSRPDDPIEQASTWLRSRLHQRPTVAATAANVGLAETTLRRRFLRCHGIPIGSWMIRERIARAEVLLQRHSIDEVSDALGYPDRFAFSRQFKQVTGVPPGRWRAQA